MKIVFWWICIFICHTAFGQESLKILNGQNKKPLVGASLENISTGKIWITDSLGNIYDNLPPGTYEVRHLGYANVQFSLDKNSPTKTVALQPNYLILQNVEVKGYENNASYLSVAGSYSLVNHDVVKQFGQESLVRAINTTPGVRMEERSPVSYRLSIRGSLLRAPFGVRNVKVYWNDIPYTDPTGNSYLYFIDNQNIQNIEIIKGPSGSIYGAGMGGVMILNSKNTGKYGLEGNLGVSLGSYGYKKIHANIDYSSENFQTSLKYAGQKGDGYRDHTHYNRNVFQLKNNIQYSEKGKLAMHILYSDLFYELPGGLTLEQYNENPRQARQQSIDQNAYVDHKNVLIGINHFYRWNKRTGNSTTLYYNNGVKENPFITNYELEKLNGVGTRTTFYRQSHFLSNNLTLTGGLEFQYGEFHASNHDNNGGYAGLLRFEDESKIYQGFVFAQAEYQSKSDFIVSVGASYNYLKYDISRLKDVATDSSYRFTRQFRPVLSPRIGAVKLINPSLSVHASVSRGFSPPAQEEIRVSDGSVNTDLQAEKGTNYEVGLRGNGIHNKLLFDITGFYMNQKETIVSKIEAGGNSKFENAGKTDQKGVEALLAYSFIDNPDHFFSFFRMQVAYTFHHFTFKEYEKSDGNENIDYSGNDLTGTAPNILVTNIQLKTRPGIFLYVNHNFTDKIPLNDANTVYSESYQLTDVKLGWQKQGKTSWELFVGIDNLLNEKYSLGNDLNAFGGRYYEPSPDRNYFMGMNISF